MKNSIIKSVILLLAIGLLSCKDSKKEGKELVFKVYGNCEMCKKTIEGSLKDTQGVNFAEWNENTKMMSVYYDPTKINEPGIQKKIAEAGYDTETEKGDDAAYKNLPNCCQYERKK
jgi:mercuric ion binding protein